MDRRPARQHGRGELSRIFGDDIDFHSDLRRGDHFSVIYEVAYHQGAPSAPAESSRQSSSTRHPPLGLPVYHPNGTQDYYNQDGKACKEGFLRSPARVLAGQLRLFHAASPGFRHLA